MPERLTYAVVGTGVMGRLHLEFLAELAADVEVVAVVDAIEELAHECAAPIGARAYGDVCPMLEELRPDVVVVSTPHLAHAAATIASLEGGSHVLVEKPIAIDVAEADAMLRAATRSGRELIVDLEYRFIPAVEAAKKFIDDGGLGRVIRATCVESTMRSAAYYASAPWRGTWSGEGGGVLVNQAPHPLDLLCYLGGTPVRVVAWTPTLSHAIECEDTVLAQVEFADGGVAQAAFSTAEATPLRIEIVGDRGRIELTAHSLTLTTWTPDLTTHVAEDTSKFDQPAAVKVEVDLPPYGGERAGHVALHREVVGALRSGRPPRTAAATALPALEVANAIALSSARGGVTVDLPLDRDDFTEFLSSKQKAVA